jgi:hypothetical protein
MMPVDVRFDRGMFISIAKSFRLSVANVNDKPGSDVAIAIFFLPQTFANKFELIPSKDVKGLA